MNDISITGYEQDGHCEHCGRSLKHCIRISDGRIVGATCFDKVLTKERTYQNKAYRVGTQGIIRLAKIAQYVSPAQWQNRHGLSAINFTFERA